MKSDKYIMRVAYIHPAMSRSNTTVLLEELREYLRKESEAIVKVIEHSDQIFYKQFKPEEYKRMLHFKTMNDVR